MIISVSYFILIISFSLGQVLPQSSFAKHGEPCISDMSCQKGLFCKMDRCYTKYETSHLEVLGLLEQNTCNIDKPCPNNQKCIYNRCVDRNVKEKENNKKAEIKSSVDLIFAGDIKLNKISYLSGFKSNLKINYNHLFSNISKIVEKADFSLVAHNTPFNINFEKKNPEEMYRNIPKEFGEAISNGGFKAALYASPNTYNLKEKGVIDTIRFWEKSSVRALGISSTLEESKNDYLIIEKNKIKIGIINFSDYSVNIPKEKSFMINIISTPKIKEIVEKLKKNKVDLIIACVNWGKKNSKIPNQVQINWAKSLAYYGVNLIIGNYPSFVQPVSYVKAKNGKQALVFFSLGSLIGGYFQEKISFSALANIRINKLSDNTIEIGDYCLIPIVNRSSKKKYSVYLLSDYLEKLEAEKKEFYVVKNIIKNCNNAMPDFSNCSK